MKIVQRFIPASNKKTRPGIKMVPKFITIHETDNPNNGADAEAHAELQERGNDRTASWHLQVDDKQCIQSVPFDEVAWAAGDGKNGSGNRTSIHLEICVNGDSDYKKAVSNAAEVTKQLMSQFNIPLDHVVQHNHWSGKNCPRILRGGSKGVKWADFINMLTTVQPVELPKQPTTQAAPVQIPYPGLIKKGSRGKDVERVQRAVGVTADGIFGPITQSAVKAYQKRHGLVSDGLVGPKTWSVMF